MKMSQKIQVRVIIRIRPSNWPKSDLSTDSTPPKTCVHQLSAKSLEIVNWRNVEETLKYEFDAVHNSTASQEDIYKSSVSSVLKEVLNGQNASIFAYGPTGAGKTYTILGTDTQPGIIPQAVSDLFAQMKEESEKSPTLKYDAYISYLEIYQEKVFDLLEPKAQDLPIRQDKHNIIIPNLAEKEIVNIEQFKTLFEPASKNRMVAATKLNSRSSRSHTILLIKVVKKEQSAPYRTLTGKMYLIDLAGSENNKRTGNKGVRLKESGCINTSLFVLGQVVDALNKNKPRIPYRDSKLTRLLQDSLGGNSHTCMITNISPEDRSYKDTYTTLNLAAKSKTVINKPFKTEIYEKSNSQTTKRKLSAQEGPVCLKKRKPNDKELGHEKTSLEDQRPVSQVQPAKFLSPFLRKQRHFQEDMTAKLLSLEEKLLKLQDRGTSPGVVTSSLHKDLIDDIQKSRNDMEWMVKQNNEIKTRRGESSILEGEESQVKDKWKEDKIHFMKAVQTQILSDEKENVPQRVFQPDPNQQAKHNLSVLNLLNSGSIKELRSLQSVGLKRAKLIDNWRQMYGAFQSINDLINIPGMTFKIVETIKRNNLVSF
ncbi:kinesin-like protein KIF22-B [Anneissia japonica]|uniref:kinesin-like protein KIF22-B n=1 Tax=Anneissia japonica TaxID=1529436 RepID=UPI001425818A|nr:kinesin-like protein KIF22-B [Anneissia japonica]